MDIRTRTFLAGVLAGAYLVSLRSDIARLANRIRFLPERWRWRQRWRLIRNLEDQFKLEFNGRR